MSASQHTKSSDLNLQDLSFHTATELVAAVANKKISAVELLEATISRIQNLDKNINAVVVRDFERARITAKEADAIISSGDRRPLLGLPITVKESFNIAGLPTSWGNPLYKEWQPSKDALVISRLKAAGAIIIGKTNVPFMLGDWQSYNDIYGITNNPWNLSLTAGGSSGGSAAALAAGFVSLELGSDLAGSIRAPAHYCGVFAHKPSIDLVPLRGVGPPTFPPLSNKIDFVVAGPMARSANDLALELNVLAGPDELMDGKGYKLFLPPSRHKNLQNFRVLVIDKHPLHPTADIINRSIDQFTHRLNKAGAKVTRAYQQLPDLAAITRNYATLLSAWYIANIPLNEYKQLMAAAKKLNNDDDSLVADCLRGNTINHRDWLLTMRKRWQLQQQWRDLYQKFDVVICPVMPTLAFPHDHIVDHDMRKIDIDGVQLPYSHQYIWISIASLFGLPATIAPIDCSDQGLPIGIQIIGDYLEDNTTITFAKLIEREFGGFKPPPIAIR